MTGEKLLLSVILMCVLSLLTQTSYGEHLTEESCTVQILVPGLKGMRAFLHTTYKVTKKTDYTNLFFLPFLFCKRRTRGKRTEGSTRETRKSWPSWRDWYSVRADETKGDNCRIYLFLRTGEKLCLSLVFLHYY